MNAHEISLIASKHSHTHPYFGGVYASDTIPLIHKSLPIFYIVNTDVISGPGKHWVMIFFPSHCDTNEWFDPLGKNPSSYGDSFLNSVSLNKRKHFIMNMFPVQSDFSSKCGQFCLTMADLRVQGFSFEEAMSLFYKSNIERNDQIVTRYVTEHMSNLH